MYARKTDKFGNEMVDKDGLPLYRSLWGISNIESGHQTPSQGFGHNRAGVEYTDCLFAVIRHFASWCASEQNRPGFPKFGITMERKLMLLTGCMRQFSDIQSTGAGGTSMNCCAS